MIEEEKISIAKILADAASTQDQLRGNLIYGAHKDKQASLYELLNLIDLVQNKRG